MASEKPAAGPEPQPAGLISVGAGGGGGGGGSVAVMGELRASGAGSVVLPAGMINPSVPIRNIRMKFAVLIGLIQVGEVSNRDIVETVLNLGKMTVFVGTSRMHQELLLSLKRMRKSHHTVQILTP